MFDYISKLPLPVEQIPQGLKDLLFIEDNSNPQRDVTVTHRYERNKYQDDYDYTHMIMAVVPEDDVAKLSVLRESSEGSLRILRHTAQRKVQLGDRYFYFRLWIYCSLLGSGSHYSFFGRRCLDETGFKTKAHR